MTIQWPPSAVFRVFMFIFCSVLASSLGGKLSGGSSQLRISSNWQRLRVLAVSTRASSNSTNDPPSLLICGPSGVGKGTIITRLLQEFPHRLSLSVSRTSRAPREGEVEGVHYFFVSKEELLNDVKHGPYRYLEHAEVHGNIYGTREDAVQAVHRQGKICILDLDVVGAKRLIDIKFPMKSIFVTPPSLQSLEERLSKRGTETVEQKTIRLNNAKREIEYGTTAGNFDHIVVNRDVDKAYEEVVSCLRNWFPIFGDGSRR